MYFALFIYFVLLYFVFTGPLYGILQLVQIFKYSLSLCIIFLMQGSADCYPVLSAQSSAASQCMFQCSVSSPVYPAQSCGQVFQPIGHFYICVWTRFPALWTSPVPNYKDASFVMSVPFHSKPGMFLMADTSCATNTVILLLLCYKCLYCCAIPWVS